ncbi:solute carrier family 26 member 6-like isoform X2 [Planococcus citri]
MYVYKEYKKPDIYERIKHKREKLNILQILVSIFPILEWLPKYKWHTDLFHDIVSGLTVAIMHIPQGIAYSILAGVQPVVGIYMAFFPVIIYAMMGTSRQLSMGTFAIICMMAGKSVSEFANGNPYTAIQVACAVTAVVGVWQVLFGVFRMGSLCVILSEHLISGLVTGTAILVINSQLKHLFGLSLPKHNGSLKVIYTMTDVVERFKEINYVAFAITITVMVVLLSYQQFLKDRVKKKIPIPIPTELIAIVSGTLLSKYFDLATRFKLTTVGEIPTGFPAPAIPPVELFPKLVMDGLVIAVISFSVNISMASIFAEKHQYRINANQELIAAGASNIFGAFFSCAPFAASLSRSLIQDTTGGRTQLASLISCSFLSLVILFIAPFFEPLPHCVLTGIVFAAMKGMLVNVKDFFTAWRQSKPDGFIWLMTFSSVILIDIDIGLCVGVIISLLYITVLGQKVKIEVLGNIPNTDIYVYKNKYQAAVHIPGVLILHIVAGMNFANKESIRQGIYKKINKHKDLKMTYAILDMSAVSYIDPSSVKCLLHMYENLKSKHITLYLAKCSSSVLKVLLRCRFFDVFPEVQLFPSIHEAVLHVRYS